jgi:hypothetical protein
LIVAFIVISFMIGRRYPAEGGSNLNDRHFARWRDRTGLIMI